MKLPSFFKKAVPREYFLALLLQDEMLRAVVFEENNGTIHVVGEGKDLLPAPLDDTAFEELLSAADKAISAAESTLPNNAQSHKTIFGVKEDWTEDLQISKDHLVTLKKLCDELDLQPIGFLVFAEAIAHLLQKEEGAPVSAVLVELGTRHITATLLRAGRVVGSKQAEIADNLPKAVDSLLMGFTDVEILPSRIILLDNQKRPPVIKQFINHSWSKQLPFLHIPQITPLADGFETQAILFGTATQMGFDMLGLPVASESKSPEANVIEKEKESKNHEETEEAEETQETEEKKVASNAIEKEEMNESEEVEPVILGTEETSESEEGDNFGFVKDADVLEAAPKKPTEVSGKFANETFADIAEEVKEKEEGLFSKLPGLGINGVMITEGMKKVFGKIRKALKNIPKPSYEDSREPRSYKKYILFIPVIVVLCIGALLWYIFGVKATATLLVDPKVVEKSQGVTFSSTSTTDVSADTIGGSTTPVTESGTSSTQATGSQDVGDKAKGTVTVYNNDDTSHTIDAGSTITAATDLKFVTNKDVTVASASGDVFTGTKPGTQSVDVTASDIGTDYNLPSGTKFTIGSSTVLAAKNDAAFSGGTKKTVTVVAQKDLDTLISNLTKTLGDKAKQDAQTNAGTEKVVLTTFLSTDVSNQKFDHKVGDLTDTVNLAATITYSALLYTKTDMDKIAVAIMQANNPGEDISAQNVTEAIQNPTVAKDAKNVTATLDIKADLLPKIDTTKVAQQLAGKSFTQALNILNSIPQLSSVRGVLSPNLFFLPRIYPRIASHITVGIKANE